MAKKKKQKEKIIYYDDNSTIADMTNVTGLKGKPQQKSNTPPPTESKWKTFWRAFRMMLIPTAVVLLIMAVIALILLLLAR